MAKKAAYDRKNRSIANRLASPVINGSVRSASIFPIRILRVRQIPRLTAAAGRRQPLKIIGRRWRRGRPLERPGIPGIIARDLAVQEAGNYVPGEDHDC